MCAFRDVLPPQRPVRLSCVVRRPRASECGGVADDIEVHCYPDNGQVTLTCGAEAFARVWAAVVAEAGPIDGAPPVVRVVLIERVPPARTPARWRDRLGLLGCGVVGFAVLFVLAIGVGTIAGWVR
jgi:hypothetical protein